MENIPSRLASALVGLDDKEIERILRDEIRAALNDASAEVKNDEDSEHEEISN
jgi:DNA-binding protein YbaB